MLAYLPLPILQRLHMYEEKGASSAGVLAVIPVVIPTETLVGLAIHAAESNKSFRRSPSRNPRTQVVQDS